MKYIVNQEQPLLEALELLSPGSSKTSLRSWLKIGRVLVDGKVEKLGTFLVKKGQVVELGERKKFTDDGIRIVFEDAHFIVVDKPLGMLSVATAYEKNKTVHAFLKKHFLPKRVYVVHRLDQETSGIMIFALSEEARDKLKKLFEKHDLKREYAALVEGHLPTKQGTWESLLYEDGNYHVHVVDDPEIGENAITHYKVLGTSKKYSWLNLTLETGKKNQIRVHCQAAGIPIAGDTKYGAVTNPLHRLCLHAHLLAFNHPITKKAMHFTSPIPEQFYQIIKPL
jgi:23S rRNA pseudouridine1911/1915/1917 synthase